MLKARKEDATKTLGFEGCPSSAQGIVRATSMSVDSQSQTVFLAYRVDVAVTNDCVHLVFCKLPESGSSEATHLRIAQPVLRPHHNNYFRAGWHFHNRLLPMKYK